MAERERELIDTGRDKRYVRRDDRGRFTSDQVNVGRSASSDRRQHTDTPSKHGHGERGDRPTRR